jgi:hypothetical protein
MKIIKIRLKNKGNNTEIKNKRKIKNKEYDKKKLLVNVVELLD